MNELFLTRVGVYGGGLSTPGVTYATTPDGNTVDHGSTHYVYDWPNEGGGSYIDFLFDLWRSRVTTRDGRRVASLDALRYIESIADNITLVVRNRPDAEVIELESRYYRYPTDASVDRVSAQRFGSGPPSPHDGWSTTAPRLENLGTSTQIPASRSPRCRRISCRSSDRSIRERSRLQRTVTLPWLTARSGISSRAELSVMT